ncbi:MAG: hypothetical protein DRP55_08460 [Spirochaetes bacterium]|nr:MAG: hypothetical protein DRP55_08460 [Spirochaetota bacterium]
MAKFNKKGIMIVILGPDGSGKTTVKEELTKELRSFFPSIFQFYFRPEMLPFPGVLLGLREDIRVGVNPNPHGHKKENPIKSFARFFYYLIDFIAGYWIKVYPLIKKGSLVIFDRYYYDYLVDLFRYNMSIPSWFPKIFLPFIHAPDITIYLDASYKILYKRKQEIPKNELKRQIKAYNNLINKFSHAITISAEKPVKEIVKEITDIIQNIRNKNG